MGYILVFVGELVLVPASVQLTPPSMLLITKRIGTILNSHIKNTVSTFGDGGKVSPNGKQTTLIGACRINRCG